MNERIKLLAEQAGFLNKDEESIEYFAELIICECAAEADRQTIYCRGIPWGRWIKEHFRLQN